VDHVSGFDDYHACMAVHLQNHVAAAADPWLDPANPNQRVCAKLNRCRDAPVPPSPDV
jgi:hypothetical protein